MCKKPVQISKLMNIAAYVYFFEVNYSWNVPYILCLKYFVFFLL